MAVAAIVAVAHDILITVGIYSLASFLVTPDTVVAFLTVLGYSLYDTIVVFDRVRDNSQGPRRDREAVVHRRREPVDEPDPRPVHQHLARRDPSHPRRAGPRRRDPRCGHARVLRPRPFDRPHERGLLVDLHRLAAARDVKGARGALPAHPRAPRVARHRDAADLARRRGRGRAERPGAERRCQAPPPGGVAPARPATLRPSAARPTRPWRCADEEEGYDEDLRRARGREPQPTAELAAPRGQPARRRERDQRPRAPRHARHAGPPPATAAPQEGPAPLTRCPA